MLIILASQAVLIVLLALFLINMQQKLNVIRDNANNAEIRLQNSIKEALQQQAQQEHLLAAGLNNNLQSMALGQKNSLDTLYNQLHNLTQLSESKMDKMRYTLEDRLQKMQNDNSEKIEKMRLTVEEKLQETLEKRLNTSFSLVSERLEMMHQGLGEVKNLASEVGDLRKILSNVKTRGIFGEVQLFAILEQLLTTEQYMSNVAVRPNSQERVEFAVKLPGRDSEIPYVLLPIDAKFPLVDYQRLLDAQTENKLDEVEAASKALENNLKKCAKSISDKYLHPPYTTDFAIMFLPIEGLFGELLRRPGLIESLQRDYKIIVTGPTTLAAILNSLQIGFKTLAIEKYSSKVWQLLEIVRQDFGKVVNLLGKTRQKLEQAGQAILQVENRSKTIHRRIDEAFVHSTEGIGKDRVQAEQNSELHTMVDEGELELELLVSGAEAGLVGSDHDILTV